MVKDDDSDRSENAVQLGFSECVQNPMHLGHVSASWDNWDGGIVGGKPSWLNPKHIPKNPLMCTNCSMPLRFLCQLYAPADQVNSSAYHRTLYIFGCPGCSPNKPQGSIRVLRCILPQENLFFPDTGDSAGNWKQHLSSTHDVSLCHVCGQRSAGECPVQKMSFCSREHQKEYKKYCFGKKSDFLPSVYKQSELVVDEEPKLQKTNEETREALIEAQEHDPDEDLEQEDIDEMMGKKIRPKYDNATIYFQERIQRAQDQCLRYYTEWEGEELWMKSEPTPDMIPNCPYCGSERKCEFQIMPQMLYHLLEDHRKREKNALDLSTEDKQALSVASEIVQHASPENVPPLLKERHDQTVEKIKSHLLTSEHEIDWGVVMVYTCVKSCGDGEPTSDDALGAYREEFAWVQPPP